MSERYFLGAVSGGRFVTEFDSILGDSRIFTYILKGGAGTGKSSLMKKTAEHFGQKYKVIRFHCSSDPNSLDAIVIPELGAAICDGTSPHVFEPKYPGICQRYIDLGEYWNKSVLDENRDNIIAFSDRNKYLHACAKRCNYAAFEAYSELYSVGKKCLLHEKIEQFADKLTNQSFVRKTSHAGTLTARRLTALTEYGFMTFEDTLTEYKNIIAVSDAVSAAKCALFDSLCGTAHSYGYDTIFSPDQMLDGQKQHILIPEISTAFVSADVIGENVSVTENIDLSDCYDAEKLEQFSAETETARLTAEQMSANSAKYLREAKLVHDNLENCYIRAMDHAALDRLTERLINAISD